MIKFIYKIKRACHNYFISPRRLLKKTLITLEITEQDKRNTN